MTGLEIPENFPSLRILIYIIINYKMQLPENVEITFPVFIYFSASIIY